VRAFFGTDGVRGVANDDLTPELAFAIGRAGATALAHESERHRPVIVGRDTRLSGTMLEAAIVAGITSVGRDVLQVGIVPTPAVARITVAENAAAGVMISASHNPIADNGIKFFGPDGFKLSDDLEHELYGTGADLRGLRVVVDGAFGAAYAIAPYALRKLGADVIEINCENDGARINVECGATHLGPLQSAVERATANGDGPVIGVAFDGDADRALFVDETGAIVSGDHVMFAVGCALHACGDLTHDTIVGTVMSNIGFERALARAGITLVRTAVGDRYVLERMQSGGFVLGGEQSGHIIDLRRNTTGDGPMTAVTLLGLVHERRASLHELVRDVVVAPQVLVNVRTPHKNVLEVESVREAIARAESELAGAGRLLIRPSGTEPLIRVMAEGDDRQTIERIAGDLARQIEQASAIL